MPLVDGRTYLNSIGEPETVGGNVKKTWHHPKSWDLSDVVWTMQGNWYYRSTGKRFQAHPAGLIDDYDIPRDQAITILQEKLDMWVSSNPPCKLRLIKSTLDNLRVRIAMHKGRFPLKMFNDVAFVHSLVTDVEAAAGETLWDVFPELAAARKIYATLELPK